MDDQDKEIFWLSASFGLTLGLEHRYEWYINSLRMLRHGIYSEITEHEKNLNQAFLVFEKTLASCPEEELEYKNMVFNDFIDRINTFYATNRKSSGILS